MTTSSPEAISQRIIELIAGHAPLDVSLSAISRLVEQQLPDALVSVMLYRPEHEDLSLIAGDSFSPRYRQALQSVAVRPENGTCGSAAYQRELVVTQDIQSDNRWQDYRELARSEHLGACWSLPILAPDNRLLGTFATYYRHPHPAPTPAQLTSLHRASGLAALAIAHRHDRDQRDQALTRLRLLERGIEASPNGVVIADALSPDMPLVYVNSAFLAMTGYSEEEVLGHNCRFLQGPDTAPEAVDELRSAIAERREVRLRLLNYRKDGSTFWNLLSLGPLLDETGQCTHFFGIQQDVTQQWENERQLAYQACHDTLTGLPNRQFFEAALRRCAQRAGQYPEQLSVLFFIDLDEFKPVNDGLGHCVGDQLLTKVALRLKYLIPPQATLARLGSDEFIILLPDETALQQASALAQRIVDELTRPFVLEEDTIHISASVGLASGHLSRIKPNDLLHQADLAMQGAKQQGRNTWLHYGATAGGEQQLQVTLRRELQEAIERDQLEMHYQPIVDAAENTLCGLEALVRWRHPVRGLIAPDLFIPLAERTGQIVALGQWVLRRVCQDMVRDRTQRGKPLPVAVNISPLQFRRTGFIEELTAVLAETGLSAEQLELELTEGVLMSGTEQTIERLNAVRKLGVQVAIDDFGTGFSSLSYLRDLPINKIKLDRSFIRAITSNRDNAAIVQGLITMAHHLGLNIVAEGVETREQLEDLHRRGCDLLQGFYFSKPLPMAQLQDLPAQLPADARTALQGTAVSAPLTP